MLLKFAVIFIVALVLATLSRRLKLPELLGMLLGGVLLGPYFLGWLSQDFIVSFSDLRTTALIIILIRAGLGIKKDTLKKVGLPAIKMSCIPCLLEGGFIMAAAYYGLKMPLVEAGLLAFILAAVSPAVIVPQMLNLIENGAGRKKGIPTLVLASASVDDVFSITMFGVFLGLANNEMPNLAMTIVQVPLKIGIGIIFGFLVGYLLVKFLTNYDNIRDTQKVMIVMILAIFIYELEKIIPMASLVAIMAVGFVLLEKNEDMAHRLAQKFNKAWLFAEIVLFVLIGAQVNIKLAISSGLAGLFIIFIGLIGRSLGVLASLAGSDLNWKEKLFCVFAYVPKATVQAAIGAIPFQMGIAGGENILAIAVLSIVVTAPLGSILIKLTSGRLLETPDEQTATEQDILEDLEREKKVGSMN